MHEGSLSSCFNGIAYKRLSAVETTIGVSRQHEFQGSKLFIDILGIPEGKVYFNTRFLYLGDDEEDNTVADGILSWYDSRADKPHRSSEYRLYYRDNPVVRQAIPGDLLLIALRPNGEILCLICKASSSAEAQVIWLFGLGSVEQEFKMTDAIPEDSLRNGIAGRYVMDAIGLVPMPEYLDHCDEMLARFGNQFPKTRDFSTFARKSLGKSVNGMTSDDLLLAWLDREEKLFRWFERHIVEKRLQEGFETVDEFVAYSLAVQNRRKSRAGLSLENHLEALFDKYHVAYSHTPTTENSSKPDFIFPSIKKYKNPSFPICYLTMLGAKTSCKDRWRQILSEADRIAGKHLLTLEPSISAKQTAEMQERNLRLIVPKPLHRTYTEPQRDWLMDVNEFLQLLADKEKNSSSFIC